MKKNFDIPVKNSDGSPMKRGDKDVLMRDVIGDTLKIIGQNDHPDGKERYDRWKLATKIEPGGDLDLTVEELALIKKVVGMACHPYVLGPIYETLDKGE